MPSQFFSRPWDSQPQRAVGLAPAFSRAGAFVGYGYRWLVGATYVDGGSGLSAPAVGLAGWAIGSVASSGSSDTVIADNVNATNFTVFALVEFNDAGTSEVSIIDSDKDTNRCFQLRRAFGGTIEAIRFNTTLSSIVSINTSGAAPVDKPIPVVLRVTGLDFKIFALGEKVTGAITGTPQTFKGNIALTALWGGGPTATVSKRVGKLYQYAVIPDTIPDAIIEEFLRNPWSLFEPHRLFLPVSTGASSLPTLSAATYVPGSLTSSGFRPRVTAS